MAKSFLLTFAGLVLCSALLPHAYSAESPGLTKLQGTWSGKRTADNGAELVQTLEIAGDKLTYTLANADNEIRLFARGTVKAERLGPFQVLKLSDIQAGRSATDTQAVEDDRTTIYVLGEDTLTLANNLDKERENQKPSLDTYKRTARAKAASAEKLAGKWKLIVKLGDADREYDLAFAGAEGTLAATLTSPRSGEHKFKSVSFSEGKLTMELTRDIQGNEATFVYNGELKDEALSGSVTVKGYEDQFKGTWTAKR